MKQVPWSGSQRQTHCNPSWSTHGVLVELSDWMELASVHWVHTKNQAIFASFIERLCPNSLNFPRLIGSARTFFMMWLPALSLTLMLLLNVDYACLCFSTRVPCTVSCKDYLLLYRNSFFLFLYSIITSLSYWIFYFLSKARTFVSD